MEDEFEVVPEDRLEYVKNAIGKEEQREVTQDNKLAEKAIIDITEAKPPFPEAIRTPTQETDVTPETTKIQAQEANPEPPTDEPAGAPTPENTATGPEVEAIGAVEDISGVEEE